jgi:hypothetical protein
MREESFEETGESWTLKVIDAAGGHRELYLEHDEERGAPFVTAYHDTEHVLVPLDREQAKALARWLVERVGLPAGLEYRAGRLDRV